MARRGGAARSFHIDGASAGDLLARTAIRADFYFTSFLRCCGRFLALVFGFPLVLCCGGAFATVSARSKRVHASACSSMSAGLIGFSSGLAMPQPLSRVP